jgi:hypothetical protein
MIHNCLLSFFDKYPLWGKISIRKTGLNVKTKSSQVMEECFRPVLQLTIIKVKSSIDEVNHLKAYS